MKTVTPPPHDSFLPAPVRTVLPYFLLVLAVFFAYANSFENSFVFDDDLLIQMNTYLRGWDHIWDLVRGSTTSGAYIAGGFYRPVQMLLYLVAFQLGDGSTFPFHLLNLSFHAINACLVYKLGTKLGFKPQGIFLAALIWALHPLHTEAITYMSATADPLFALFCLWAIIALLPDISPQKILKIIPLFLLGLLTKETTVMMPLLVIACLFFVSPGRLDWRTYVRTWPLWVITIAFTIWRMNADFLDGPKTFAHLYGLHNFSNLKMYADSPVYRFYTFLATLPIYAVLLVWPVSLHMERSFSIYTEFFVPPVMTGAVILVLAAAQIVYSAIKKRKAGYPLAWGLLWFGAAHSPDSGILVQMNALFLEHWMYLPSVGLFLGLAETLSRALQNRPKALTYGCVAAALAFAGLMATKTYAQNGVWLDPPHFYNNIFRYGEHSARARNNLALYYGGIGDYPDAVEQFKQAIMISDSYAETRHNLALIYLRMGEKEHMQDAIDNLNRAIEIDPQFYRSYQTLGDIYGLLLHDESEADYYHAKAVEYKKLRE